MSLEKYGTGKVLEAVIAYVASDPANPVVIPTTTSSVFTPSGSSGVGSLASANTDYTVVAANATRRMVLIQNTHASAVLFVNPVGLAWSGSALQGIQLSPGQALTLDVAAPNTALHAASATAGATYFLLEG